jgi:hypothetical protein
VNLETWLDIATKNLAPRAAAKVHEDITAHVESSVEHHQLEGMNSEEARALAVRELGNAISSAKKFESVYLTRTELTRVTRDREWARSFGWIAVAFLAILVYFIVEVLIPTREWELVWGQPLFLLTQVFWHGTRWFTAGNPSLHRYAKAQLVLQPIVLIGTLGSSVFFVQRYGLPSVALMVVYAVLIVAWSVQVRRDFLRWQKLRAP